MKPFAFIIITYNRPADCLELLENIASLNEANDLLEEVIIVNNASTSDYSAVESFVSQPTGIPFSYHYSDENLGVARGRNLAIRRSSAEILIMLDDDAVLDNKDALTNLIDEFSAQRSGRPTAIVSFKVLYYENRQMQKNALPHKRYNEYKDKHFFETYFYAGGAHAIRRSALEQVGHYPTDFFYGMEEYDLSYRLLDAGFAITYSDRIIMLHKESPLGRKPKKEKVRMMWVNKSKVTWRYLPARYFYSTAFMWSMQYLKETGFDMIGFVKGWREVFTIPSSEERKEIKPETVEYIRSLKGRLWY